FGALEFAYSQVARRAGIRVPETRLFETAAGERFFGVRRFDREGFRRRHVHTFGNLIHADFRLPSCDYRDLLTVTQRLTRHHESLRQAFLLMAFNVASHNRDDHAKNFAFLMDRESSWRLAPAYDLTFAEGPGGEHMTSVAGEGRAPGRGHLLSLGAAVGLERAEAGTLIDRVVEAVSGLEEEAREHGVSAGLRREVARATGPCVAGLRG
ncbi:MAG: HipA domain-containing protein, partial [Acidobacteriota bacterium]